jgi:sugar phosphate isomerase/epimerase
MKLGVNTVLFKDFTLRETFAAIARAGYDGVELSAISGMCEHLILDGWEAQAEEILALSRQYGLALLSMEAATLDEQRLTKAFAAAKGLGIPVVNVGPGGQAGDDGSLKEQIGVLRARSALAAKYGTTLCVKAHVGSSIHDTPTTQRAMQEIPDASFGIDMDPSHIHRAGETPKESLKGVISRVKHVHIRDCKGAGPSPGDPVLQTCGRGDIDLFGYFRVLAEAAYTGPVCLEIIGPAQSLEQATTIAAENRGYMNACLKILGVR